ncbi:MAG: hypothetical protein NT092_06275 [Bacteroidia bacterium]|nr:hypothetical protein [Bacteroidia bacterium]
MPHTSSYRRILHRMGYYNYQQGLIYRHLNQLDGWDNHLAHCREFIIKALDEVRPSRITVLGSGWLMELPLAEMAERTKKICLIDIVHPPEVFEQTSSMKNVEISDQDVSGGLIEEVWNKAGNRTFFNRLQSLDKIVIPAYDPVEDPGMVISLNILTQLEILPEKLLRKKSKATEQEFFGFRKEVQEKHISFLRKHPSILISDVKEVVYASDSTLTENSTLLAELPHGKLTEEWIWDFDLMHEDFNRKKSQFRVVAVLF